MPPVPFDAVTRHAVVSVCELAGVDVVVDGDGDTLTVTLDAAGVAALLDAASGAESSTGATGRWADHASGRLVTGLCDRDGDAWRNEATMHVAELLADAADHFDAVAALALDGPVRFTNGDAVLVAGDGFPSASWATAWATWATTRPRR